MKLLSGIMGAALTGVVALASGHAADISGPGGSLKDPYVPFTSWTGFYLGAHAGVAEGWLKVTDFNENPSKFTNRTEGLFGGGQFGYNVQRGNVVFGVEADLGGMNLSHGKAEPVSPTEIKSVIGGGFYGDVTGRLGYLSGARTLVYAKGGFAFYDGDVKVIDIPESGTAKAGTFTGWTLGAGVEHKFTPSWSIKAEYQYFDFGSHTNVMSSDLGDHYKNELTAHTLKVGFNYFVGPAYEPLK